MNISERLRKLEQAANGKPRRCFVCENDGPITEWAGPGCGSGKVWTREEIEQLKAGGADVLMVVVHFPAGDAGETGENSMEGN
jgi:hypothetical protein